MGESEHFCYDCAFKHISAAKVVWNELNMGYFNNDHISYVVGNLHAAEVHLFELYPDIANDIRAGRKLFWDGVLDGDIVRVDFDKYLDAVMTAATELNEEEVEASG